MDSVIMIGVIIDYYYYIIGQKKFIEDHIYV